MWVIRPLFPALLFVVATLYGSFAHAADGAALYKKHCETCHQSDGWGIPFMAASLVDSTVVNGDAEYMAWVVVTGTGNIEGWTSDIATPMPSFRTLPDSELAAILTYVRATFGNNKNEISVEQVSRARARTD